MVEEILAVGQTTTDVVVDPHLICDGWEKYKDEAIAIRNQYFSHIQGLLDTYGIDDEWQLISGHMMRLKNRLSDNDREDFSFYNTEKIVGLRIGRIWAEFLDKFFANFTDLLDNPDSIETCNNEDVFRKASAWYIVTYDYQAHGNHSRMLSFPWMLWRVLYTLKRRHTWGKNGKADLINPIFDHFDEVMQNKWCNGSNVLPSDFTKELATPVITKYITLYPDLYRVLATLLNWCYHENVFGTFPNRRMHHRRLLRPIQVLLFFLHWAVFKPSTSDYVKSDLVPLVKPTDIDAEIGTRNTLSLLSPAAYLLKFIKWLASEDFRNQFSFCFHPDLDASFEIKQIMLFNLHQVAFKTYHHIALTGNFQSLYLIDTPSNSVWDFDEGDPMMIEWNGQVELARRPPFSHQVEEIIHLLVEWSGVDDINLRNCGRHNVLVSASGKMEARHRLRQILLSDNLWPCLLNTKENPIYTVEF